MKITAKYDNIFDADDDKSIILKDSYVNSLKAFVSNDDTPDYTINENIDISEKEIYVSFCRAFETVQKKEKHQGKLFNSLLLSKLCELDTSSDFSMETFINDFSKYLFIIFILRHWFLY